MLTFFRVPHNSSSEGRCAFACMDKTAENVTLLHCPQFWPFSITPNFCGIDLVSCTIQKTLLMCHGDSCTNPQKLHSSPQDGATRDKEKAQIPQTILLPFHYSDCLMHPWVMCLFFTVFPPVFLLYLSRERALPYYALCAWTNWLQILVSFEHGEGGICNLYTVEVVFTLAPTHDAQLVEQFNAEVMNLPNRQKQAIYKMSRLRTAH